MTPPCLHQPHVLRAVKSLAEDGRGGGGREGLVKWREKKRSGAVGALQRATTNTRYYGKCLILPDYYQLLSFKDTPLAHLHSIEL